MNISSETKVQVDRWPVSDLPRSPFILSIIAMKLFPHKPTKREIITALAEAAHAVNELDVP